jgi:hypothetical protein
MVEEYYEDCGVKIETIGGLLRQVKSFVKDSKDRRLYFRGVDCVSHDLKPTIGRSEFYKHGGRSILRFDEKQERELLHRFRRYAYSITKRHVEEWEALFIARHHNLPVRLLDWTSNPLVALYNAVKCEAKPSQDGAIWVFKRNEDDSRDLDVFEQIKKGCSPFCVKGIRIIYPAYVDPRMVAQSGCFTIQEDPWKSLELCKDTKPNDIRVLRKWLVPSGKRCRLLEDLQRMSIDSRSLYPDLDGLAKGLWQLEVMKAGVTS